MGISAKGKDGLPADSVAVQQRPSLELAWFPVYPNLTGARKVHKLKLAFPSVPEVPDVPTSSSRGQCGSRDKRKSLVPWLSSSLDQG